MQVNKVVPEPADLDLQLQPLGKHPGPPRGLSMSALLCFALRVEQLLGPDATTEQVVACLVKPETAHGRCSFLQLLPDADVGVPDFFVSHCWGARFLDTVEALRAHLQLQDDEDDEAASTMMLWMDVFCVNQHALGGEHTNVGALLDHVHEAVGSTQTMLLCIDERAEALGRAWVQYEVWAGSSAGRGAATLELAVHAVNEAQLYGSYRRLDPAKAEASFSADREAILRRVQQTCPGGLEGMRATVRQALLASAVSQGERALAEKVDDPLTLADHLTRSAWLLKALGAYEQAQPLCLRVLEIREKVLGPSHPDTASSLNNLAMLMKEQGKLEAARVLYEQTLRIKERTLGANHADTATALSNLAGLLHRMGQDSKAMALDKQALVIREEVLGIDHPETISSRKHVAHMIKHMHRQYELGTLGSSSAAASNAAAANGAISASNLLLRLSGGKAPPTPGAAQRPITPWAKMLTAFESASRRFTSTVSMTRRQSPATQATGGDLKKPVQAGAGPPRTRSGC